MFSSLEDSPWSMVYFAMLNLLLEEPDPDDGSKILDNITNGPSIEWETEVSDFIQLLKASPGRKPTLDKGEIVKSFFDDLRAMAHRR